jgi:AraC family L-rhamnose operon regulatory protein RhaS
MHRNQGMEIVYVEQGRLRWTVDGKAEEINSGSVFFTMPWQAHGSQYAHEPGNVLHFVLACLDKPYRKPVNSFLFHPSMQIPPREARRISRLCCRAPRHGWPASSELQWVLAALVSRLHKGGTKFHANALFMTLISELAEIVSSTQTSQPGRHEHQDCLESFLHELESRCTEAWTWPGMARACGMTKSLMFQQFKALTGDSPLVYLKRLRVMRAERLLAETELSVTEIAHQCGFCTSQIFARTFRQFTNHSPTEFRCLRRQDNEATIIDYSVEDERKRFRSVQEARWL